MLTSLSIQNIVLIEQQRIAFEPGLTVLTGETGAGKSILLDCLGLALGERAAAGLVRQGAAQGSVVAVFQPPEAVMTLCADRGVTVEDELIIRRVVSADGKSKAFINDEPVSLNLLKEIGENLVEIHGQHDQKSLMLPALHREQLDAYAGLGKELTTLREAYATWRGLLREKAALQEELARTERERDYLSHVAQEIAQLAPHEGEEQQLADQRLLLQNREKLSDTLQNALDELRRPRNVAEAIRQAQRALLRGAPKTEPELFAPVIEALERGAIELDDAEMQLEALARDDASPAHNLEAIEERLFAIRNLARKYQVSPDELARYGDEVAQRLKLMDQAEDRLSGLDSKAAEARAAYHTVAQAVSERRRAAAADLEQAVMRELAFLKMEKTAFRVDFQTLEEDGWAEHGQEHVSFHARTNPGAPFGPIARIASGGELSRFMLALKAVLSGVKQTPTAIFDEIDTGIGGAVADAVGQRLADLGRVGQVLVVTHQPQVAAKGAHHLKVVKESAGEATHTRVFTLSGPERTEELARMLAGAEVTAEARAAAIRLLEPQAA